MVVKFRQVNKALFANFSDEVFVLKNNKNWLRRAAGSRQFCVVRRVDTNLTRMKDGARLFETTGGKSL